MADNDAWEESRGRMHDFIDSMQGLTPREKAARKAAYDAQHAELLASAAKYEEDRNAYLKGRQ